MAKIKRYSGGYTFAKKRRRRRIVLKSCLILCCGVLLFLLGYSLAGPIMNFVNQLNTPSTQDPSSLISTLPPSATTSTTSSPSSTSSVAEPETLTLSEPLAVNQITNLSTFRQQLDSLKSQGITGVVLEVKNETGELLYQSALTDDLIAKVTLQNAVDLAPIVQAIEDAGLTPVASLHVFKDRLAAKGENEYSIKYQNTQTRWIDNSADLGGKPWLNPYSEGAQDYILSLCSELGNMGFSHILLKSVQFPDGVALNYMGFGDTRGLTKSQVLTEFIEKAQTTLEKQNVQVLFSFPQGTDEVYQRRYGASPATLGADHLIWEKAS